MKIPESLILNGTDNNGNRHRYSFEKVKNFKKGFLEFMGQLEFDINKIKKRFIVESRENKEDGGERIIIKEIEDFVDVCWFFENSKYEVDVFFGTSKVVILVRTKSRKEVVEYLEKNADWISEEEKEKRLNKNKELDSLKKVIVK